MTRTLRHTAIAGLLLVGTAGVASSQNREHLQLALDLRALHEQVQRTQLALNTITEQIKATNARIDAQQTAMVKGFADQQYVIDSMVTTLGTLREKLNDNSVRVAQLMQEMDSIRQGIGVLQTLLSQILVQVQPAAPAADPAAPPGAGPPPVTSQPPPTGALNLPPSPTAYYQQAFGLYTSGDHALAIEAFREFLSKFPAAPDAANAQFFMGLSLYHLGRYKDALGAFGLVTTRYPESERVPEAYYQQGVCHESLRQLPEAQKLYELIRTKYPESTAAVSATMRLKFLGIIKESE